MSTIASPRESSIPPSRRLPQITTPSGSARPSMDSPRGIRSESASPNRAPAQAPRRNRAALREYYNLKREEQSIKEDDVRSESDFGGSVNDHDLSDVIESEIDGEGFDGEAFVRRCLEGQSLEELMRTYNQVLSDIRALDAEKKALVYDNYSKLIAATETIRKMRNNMDPLNPMASTLDPAISQIYERANSVKAEMRDSMSAAEKSEGDMSKDDKLAAARKKRAVAAANKVLEVPARVRQLIADGKAEEARDTWEETLRMLERWKASGKGGSDVQDCIDDGEAALRGKPPNEKSWVNVKLKS